MGKKNSLILIIFCIAVFGIGSSSITTNKAAAQDKPLLPNSDDSLKQILDPITGAPQKIKDEINKLPEKVSSFGWEWFKDKLNNVWQMIENWFYDTTGYTLVGIFTAIIKFLIGLFELVMKLFRQLYSWITNII